MLPPPQDVLLQKQEKELCDRLQCWNMLKSRFNVLAQERPRLGENGLVCVCAKGGSHKLEEEGMLSLHSVFSGGHYIIFII